MQRSSADLAALTGATSFAREASRGTMPHLAVIELTDVTKSYGGRFALRGVNLRVEAEQCVALVGPSGSGKSTLLRLALGLLTAESGEVTIGGERLVAATVGRLRLRMGYVMQDGGLFPHLTARENVTLVARHLRWERARIGRRVDELTTLTGLSRELLDRYPIEISGGERQRVAMMRALMLDPPVLLFDEPLGALDPLIRSRLQQDLRDIFRQLKKSVLLVTHDVSEAAFLGDQIAVMERGTLLQKGAIDELVRRPATPFVAEFLQSERPRWSEGPPPS